MGLGEDVAMVLKDAESEPWIVCDPAVMGGKPCVRGTRVTVDAILAHGHRTVDEIIESYPNLTPDGIWAAREYHHRHAKEIDLIVRLAWPDAKIQESDHDGCCLMLGEFGAYRFLWIQSAQDIAEIEDAVIARDLAEEYGHELIFALGMRDVFQLASNSRYIAMIAKATTRDRVNALVALARKRLP